MSTLSVEVVKIDDVQPHPDPETTRLSVLTIGGYKTITAKVKDSDGEYHCPYAVGDHVIYVPPDAIVPKDVSDHWGVTSYLGTGGRVKTVRLRGFVSRGFVVPVEPICGEGYMESQFRCHTDPTWVTTNWMPAVGDDVADYYGITKYEPPQSAINRIASGIETELPGFTRYTDIERIQRFPDVLIPGEQVVITEKLHGSNSRIASIRTPDGDVIVCGTRRNQVRRGSGTMYEYPLGNTNVVALLSALRGTHPSPESIVIFGEVYGPHVQGKMTYGVPQGSYGYRAFDIAVNGGYLEQVDFEALCEIHGVDIAPVLYTGPWSTEIADEYSDGPSTIGGGHIREGVVIKPVRERTHWELGRVILKRIGDSYEVGQYEMSDSH